MAGSPHVNTTGLDPALARAPGEGVSRLCAIMTRLRGPDGCPWDREQDLRSLKPHLLEDLKLAGFEPTGPWRGKVSVIVTRANFGCGSSREHAPWALEVNGITCVIAESFARIFRQNMFNGGMLAIELPAATIAELFASAKNGETTSSVDLAAQKLSFTQAGKSKEIAFTLSGFDGALVKSGGWVEFADSKY